MEKFDKGYFEKLDQLLHVAVTNLYTISKEDNIIRLSSVDLNNDKHWVILNLVIYACSCMDRVAYLDMPLLQYIKFLRHVGLSFRFKRENIKRVRKNGGITCDKFISDIEDANKSLMKDPFLDIAQNYYPRKR